MGMGALGLLLLFFFVGLYAPLLASSKPLCLIWDGHVYFPLLRHLFFRGFFSKPIDLFFNVLMFTLPITLLLWLWIQRHWVIVGMCCLHLAGFIFLLSHPIQDPESDPKLARARQGADRSHPGWAFELRYMSDYGKLNVLLKRRQLLQQHARLSAYAPQFEERFGQEMPTLWHVAQRNMRERSEHVQLLQEREEWLSHEGEKLYVLMPALLRPFHWEEDAGGSQAINQIVPWWELTRINRKDLVASLLFGIRVSFIVGVSAVALALLIGIPLGAAAGYFAGKIDLVSCRLIEIWEAMPTFFMLLLVISLLQSKSILLVMAILGLFSWTSFARFMRAEVLKQRSLSYVLACKSQGYRDTKIMFSHILPNAIPPILTLLPFAMMAAITSEAGLSFLGLGEEGATSWGVLMDEGRVVFPGESYLLWPPAILLTLLLVCIALVGDVLRDALDPKLQ